MFSKSRTDLFRRLSFRLTLWYALIFTVSGILLLLIFYTRVAYITREGVDEELAEEIEEFVEVMAEGGLQAVLSEMAAEELSETPGTLYLRLLSSSGEVLASFADTAWGGRVPVDLSRVRSALKAGEAYFETIPLPHHPYRMRAIFRPLGPGVLMQVGFSLEESEAYLDLFRQLLLWILAPLVVLAAAVGGFMARQALSDVDAVARTAEEIALGNSHLRVKVTRRFVEIDRLAGSFNSMVDQLHALIRQMREMTDNIAHDLRSPLTRIRGYAEMTLIGDSSPADFQEMAVNTVEECDNLIEMINTMLDIAEAESGITPITTDTVDLKALIDDACDLFGSLAHRKGVELHQEVPAESVIVSDRAKYQRMVGNLLENAIKYTPAGGRVVLSVEMRSGEACIQISDTGLGIAPEEQAKIFQRFYRCDASRSEAGMGLGLSLAKALAESLGGSLTVRSTLHKGSTFTLSIPSRALA
jgi:signal transduction histidine kinase